MKDFFKTFGLGLLYFITFPFLLIYLMFFGMYLLFKDIVYIFLYKNKKYKKKVNFLEEKAELILDNNRYHEEDKKEGDKDLDLVKEVKTSNITYNTTNNIIIANMDAKEVKKKISEDPNFFEKLTRVDPDNKEPKYIESNDVDEDFLIENQFDNTVEDDNIDELKDSIKESIKEERVDMSSLKRED